MKAFCLPFAYGPLNLASNIFYAPLAGCSGFAFRAMSAHYRPGLHYCEMVKMQALVRFDQETLNLLDYDGSMHPLGAQICGADAALAGPCAQIIEELGFDAIDLNCGCPVDKVTKDGSGSGLLRNPEKIGEIVANMRARVRIPVSVKIRSGWDEKSINGPEITKIAERAGAVAITVHGRTRAQGYRGPADWQIIAECKKAAKSILVMGNGDLHKRSDLLRMHDQTRCDGFVIARGCLGQPWICCESLESEDGEGAEGDCTRALDHIARHVECAAEYGGPAQALVELKKASTWYLQRQSAAKSLKSDLCHAKDYRWGLKMIQDMMLINRKNPFEKEQRVKSPPEISDR